MADNVAITAGAGTTIATEDVGGGRQVQLVKSGWGPSDTVYEPDIPTPLPVAGRDVLSQVTTTRPANVTAYAAGQVIGPTAPTNLVFTAVGRGNSTRGVIFGVIMSDAAQPATRLQAELWLFSAAPTAVADQGAFAPSSTEIANCIAVIPIVFSYTAGANYLVYQATGINAPFLSDGTNQLYGQLVARNAYTPVSGEVFKISLQVSQDGT